MTAEGEMTTRGEMTTGEARPAEHPPKRPTAKEELREQLVALFRAGRSVPQIAAELGVARSTAYHWTRDQSLDQSPEDKGAAMRRHMQRMQEARWASHRSARDAERAAVTDRLRSWVGDLSEREVRLIGAVAYWCEGAKQKPWQRSFNGMSFINSDPTLILVLLRFVELHGVDRAALGFRLSIHESADVAEATRWWAAVVGEKAERFHKPTLKTHKPSTVRRNTGESYRGCLIVYVPKSARLYWEIEGVMGGIAASGTGTGAASM
jgi:AcrR family transcriptional regulator